MDWHAEVYGSRGGSPRGRSGLGGGSMAYGRGDGLRGFGDEYGDPGDGVTYGALADELVPEDRLRRLGGKAFYRAHEVIDSGRIADAVYVYTDDGITLGASVAAADRYADDYEVSVHVDEDAADITASSCTCPAYGRFGAVCKHVIALVMYYDESPNDFSPSADMDADPGALRDRASRARRRQRTSRALESFMRAQDDARRAETQRRQLSLLKEIGSVSGAGGAAGTEPSAAGGSPAGAAMRHMPIGGVALRPEIRGGGRSWALRLRIGVPARNIWYVVKDVGDLVDAVRRREFRSHGRRLAFVHTRDALDERSQAVFDLIERALRIRRSVLDGMRYYQRGSDPDVVTLSGDEVAELLALYAGGDATLDYERPYRLQAEPVRVLDGDPDLGLAVERDGDAGYVVRHRLDVLDVVEGGALMFVAVAPTVAATLSGAARGGVGGDGAGSGDWSPDEVRLYRCSPRFRRARAAIEALCGTEGGEDRYLSAADAEAFMRTVVPLFRAVGSDDASAGRAASGDAASWEAASGETEPDRGVADGPAGASAGGTPRASGVDASGVGAGAGAPGEGVVIRLPAELLALRREPCAIEIFLDRDRDGVTCDVQARYGDRRYHVFAGPDEDAAMRDRDAERLAADAALHYFPRPDGAVACIPESDDEATYRLLSEGLTVLRGVGEVFSTPAFDGLTAAPRPVIRVGLSMRSGLVEISPIADEIDMADVPGLLAGYRRRRRFHRLRGGAFVDMAQVDVSQVDDVARDLGIDIDRFELGPVDVPAYSAYYLDGQADDDAKDETFRAYLDDLRVLDPQAYRVPEPLAGVLRPYQAEGFRWLNAVYDKGFGGILADEMGLGKTVQMIALLLARRDEGRAVGPDLIVCPASLVYNWQAEFRRFAPDLDVAVVAGAKAERRAMLESVRAAQDRPGGPDGSEASSDAMSPADPASPGPVRAASVVAARAPGADDGWQGADTPLPEDTAAPARPDVLVTSYDLLRRDVEEYRGLRCHCMVLDEAQYVKNHATKSSKAVRSIDARHRFALTGTPIENRLAELWSVFDFLMPGMLGPYRRFRDRFEQPILSGDERAQARLQSFVGPFILRRRKADVLDDLPDKIENVISVPLAGEQRRLYAALEQRLRASIVRERDVDFGGDRIRVLAQLTRLRQVCCDPRLAYEDVGERAGSAKLDAIEELIDGCRDAGRKVLVFSQFTSFLDLIAERLRARGVGYDTITGATPKRRRVELVDAFNHDDTPVFLISLKAGNTGLNLTGACVVIHADPWWNAAAQEQATDRAHRIGQTQDVNVYQIVAKDTIEERILELQRSKTDLAARFVDEASSATGSAVAALTRDDLLALLGG
ncbi:SNF2-related protein [Bifidobacterium phasiani]|uniref:SNF2 helicase associated domain-containing protein n=1 Tax=Bifidobacterium phasiani TaxID=2834431 RepID=A0ABS6WB54_9BIFI|nr:SNF2-related protein [Bifidobacterium phasiani]MBW3082981.1 SNF2 helicase associated domain-containing protein [Bifidobacterium phasiani]